MCLVFFKNLIHPTRTNDDPNSPSPANSYRKTCGFTLYAPTWDDLPPNACD